MKQVVVEVTNVVKQYQINQLAAAGIKNYVVGLLQGKNHTKTFNALDNVSFSARQGEAVGIIGKNGSGKSTLLSLIAGVEKPTSGLVEVKARVSPLLELGGGFHPELTGRENIVLNGVLMGIPKSKVNDRINEIIEYSELEEFIDEPIRIYSSGMLARLGFSIATQLDPELLIVDEVLAVGDQVFQKKCMSTMLNFKKNGVTILLVSHNVADIEKLCDRVIWIDNHKVRMAGDIKQVIRAYKNIDQ
ncbi:MAG: rfbB [Firmicutes bacterium]|nr:rfbB [Bacillota bacterium]